MTLRSLVRAALHEDLGREFFDATGHYFVPAGLRGRARVVAREALVVSGTAAAEEVFRQVSPLLRAERRIGDGAAAAWGDCIMELAGPVRAILAAERTALNFLQRLSGVATLTRAFVEAVAGTGATVLDTRKTTPGYRTLEKAAVRHGGGANHRMGLHDGVMVKDNHLAALGIGLDGGGDDGPVRKALGRIRRAHPGMVVVFEADTPDQAERFAGLGADRILLDNMSPAVMRRAVGLIAGRCKTEASGGITLRNARAAAMAGVDFISVGALTHSAPAADLSLEVDRR